MSAPIIGKPPIEAAAHVLGPDAGASVVVHEEPGTHAKLVPEPDGPPSFYVGDGVDGIHLEREDAEAACRQLAALLSTPEPATADPEPAEDRSKPAPGRADIDPSRLSVMFMYLSARHVHGIPVVCVDGEPHTRTDTGERCHRDSGWGWGDSVNERVASVVQHDAVQARKAGES